MFKSYKFICNSGKLPCLNRISLISSTVPEAKRSAISKDDVHPPSKENKNKQSLGTKSTLVASAFASINTESATAINTPFTDQRIKSAQTVNELLTISVGTGISRTHALKVVSLLAEWTTAGQIQLSDFESDPRFLKLCRILLKSNGVGRHNQINNLAARSEDLATILSVTADDEAAKMVENITLSQMVKVMTTLAFKKRRSSQLLRTLAYNIAANPNRLNLKQCSDVLFSMSTLNFYDENVLTKVSENAILAIQSSEELKKSSIIASILRSMGFLKYKNIAHLESLSKWMVTNHSSCRSQDVLGMFLTLGLLNFIPSNFDQYSEVFASFLKEAETGKALVWLEIVWSLVLLNKASLKQVESVLNESFIKRLDNESPDKPSSKLKLLNIDGAAQYLLKDYSGPRLKLEREIPIGQTREKSLMVTSVIDTLKNLISEKYFKTGINTGLGFFIDVECLLDQKCIPQPLETKDNPKLYRIAILTYDYHDMCKGRPEPTGLSILQEKLLEAQGYRVVTVPYTEFNLQEKLVHRVQYLEMLLKKSVSQSS